jgi:hypothetical protein
VNLIRAVADEEPCGAPGIGTHRFASKRQNQWIRALGILTGAT